MFLHFPNGDVFEGVGIVPAALCDDWGFEGINGCLLGDGG